MPARARVCLLLGMLVGPAATASAVELELASHRQEISEWGWAAATAMVVDHAKGTLTADCQVLAAYERLLGGPGTCCDDLLACLRPAGPQEIAFVLEAIYGVPGRHLPRPLTFREIVSEIDGNRPVIAALRKSGTDHVVVIVGYEGSDRMVLIDPKRGRKRASYELLRENPVLGAWRASVVLSDLPQQVVAPRERPPAQATVTVPPLGLPAREQEMAGLRSFLAPPPEVVFPVQPVCIFCQIEPMTGKK